MEDDTRKMVGEIFGLLEGAPSAEHERLREALDGWALARGYARALVALPDGGRPDVLRWNATTKRVFIGDAKVSAHEGPSSSASMDRLNNYMTQLLRLIQRDVVTGGIFAISSDDARVASEWIVALNFLAVLHGLRGPNGEPSSFRVENLGDRAWITWW